MKLYIGNCTKQVHSFAYRVKPSAANSLQPVARQQKIEIGSQIQISGDLSGADVEFITSQHRKYGLVPVEEINRTRPFIGLCYSVDKPIPVKALMEAIHHNDAVLVEVGRQNRAEAAVAVNNAIEDQNPNLQKLTFDVVEEKSGTGEKSDQINERIVVDPNSPPPDNTPKTRVRKSANT